MINPLIRVLSLVENLLSNLNSAISANESTEFITGHVIYNSAYAYKFQLKTTMAKGSYLCFSAIQNRHTSHLVQHLKWNRTKNTSARNT